MRELSIRAKTACLLCLLCALLLCGCGSGGTEKDTSLKVTSTLELKYAEQFSVSFCEGGCALIDIGEDGFILVPEGQAVPEDTGGRTVINGVQDNIYLAASSAMDLFDALGRLDSVKLTSTDVNSWSLPNVRAALEAGTLVYTGKYSAPDYELVLSSGCGVAIESTMIYHSPQVKEKLEELGIPVIVEHSSYEQHPLGRMEWVKLYGVLMGCTDEAIEWFDRQLEAFEALEISPVPEEERPTVAFFYVSPNGYVNVRKPGDYIAKMIELAGGRYVLTADMLDVEENALSTMNLQLESFYELAAGADIIIYNSTIEGDLTDVDMLLDKSPVFADFKAVKNGRVWCTGQNMFQQTSGAAEMMIDLNKAINGAESDLTFLKHID